MYQVLKNGSKTTLYEERPLLHIACQLATVVKLPTRKKGGASSSKYLALSLSLTASRSASNRTLKDGMKDDGLWWHEESEWKIQEEHESCLRIMKRGPSGTVYSTHSVVLSIALRSTKNIRHYITRGAKIFPCRLTQSNSRDIFFSLNSDQTGTTG